jgi:hypothetical protein
VEGDWNLPLISLMKSSHKNLIARTGSSHAGKAGIFKSIRTDPAHDEQFFNLLNLFSRSLRSNW